MSANAGHGDSADLDLPSLAMAATAPGAKRLARSLVWLFAALTIGLAFTPWQQNIRGAGRVVAYTPVERQQVLDSPIDGRVARWLVREGSAVKAGEVIAELSDNDPELMGRLNREMATVSQRLAAIEVRVGALDQRLHLSMESRDMTVTAADARVRMAEERLRAAEQAQNAAEAALTTAKLNLDRQTALLAKGLTSRRNLELAQLEQAQRQTEVERAKASQSAARSEVDALRFDRRKAQADASGSIEKNRTELKKAQEEMAYAQAERLKLETRLARQTTQQLKAPRDGVILRLAVSNNAEQIKIGDPLAVLVPNTVDRAVELWVDGNDVPLITTGKPVRLQFEGYPAIQFGGWPEISVGTFGGIVSLIDATDNGQGKFRLLVKPEESDDPWPDARFLRQGVRTNGWVLLNQVPLGYEFWRVFNGFPPLLTPHHSPLEPIKGKTGDDKGSTEDKGKS